MIGRSGERGSGIYVALTRHDDDEEEEECLHHLHSNEKHEEINTPGLIGQRVRVRVWVTMLRF